MQQFLGDAVSRNGGSGEGGKQGDDTNEIAPIVSQRNGRNERVGKADEFRAHGLFCMGLHQACRTGFETLKLLIKRFPKIEHKTSCLS
jgi:hypothetical protein